MAGFVYAWGMQEQEQRFHLKQVVLGWRSRTSGRAGMADEPTHYLGFKQFAGRGLRYVAEYSSGWR